MVRTSKYIFFVLFVFIGGCATSPLTESGDNLNISKIRIDPISSRSDASIEMITRCSGFILSENEVRDFLTYASRIKDDGTEKYYRILPCSATGAALINKAKYKWVIRAGGIGEFASGSNRFIAICGKNCCKKVPGIC